MGIKGTVRRSVDSNFIHTNIDIDLIITEEPEYGRADKPEEIFHIIEHFCLGKRRLYLFGRDNTIRPGWLTVGPDLAETYFDKEIFCKLFEADPTGNYTGSSERIDMLRPKTPPLKAKLNQTLAATNAALNQMNSINSSNSMIVNTTSMPPPVAHVQEGITGTMTLMNHEASFFNYANIPISNGEIQNNQFGF